MGNIRAFAVTVLLSGCLSSLNPGAEAPTPPSVEFPEAEQLLPIATKTFIAGFEGAVDLKLAFVSGREWSFDRHLQSGRIVARGTAVMFYVYNRGFEFCHYIPANMWQQDLGGGRWGKPYIVQVEDNSNKKLTCDSIDRLVAAR